ncbi:MAG: helix-turn-helix domain-containing protein [Firmicutes bacterium]|jgi:HTH-type transcriptional regulator/antitoxin HigA|nr:helix-turn-helix domain-containing protein [Bacillota bacterium]
MRFSKSVIAIPPGATIREQLENRGMKQKEFALRMGLSEKHISRLINGQVELTKDVALRLESVLGLPASFWNNLEVLYREQLARVNAENQLEKDAEIAAKFPYSKMAALGWVKPTRKAKEKVINLRKFFEVASLDCLRELEVPGIACRKKGTSETSDYSLAAWAQKARIEARKYKTAPISISQFEQTIPEVRAMTVKSPQEFCGKLIDLFSECGIALIFLPHIGGSFLHGASFYDGNHIVMGLTVRGRYADQFWFSLFHEMCHIIRGHIGKPGGTSEQEEEEADAFARDTLIPPEEYEAFIEANCFSKNCITDFASKIGIAPGVVVGRLQKENYVPYNRFNELKVKYEIVC